MGKLTMRQLIYDLCGGLKEGRTLKGVVPGGSSMPVLKADQIDVPLDFESLRKAGTMAGSGGVIVLDDTVDIVQSTLNVAQFYAHESCGQCTPCREGTLWMEKMLHRIKPVTVGPKTWICCGTWPTTSTARRFARSAKPPRGP